MNPARIPEGELRRMVESGVYEIGDCSECGRVDVVVVASSGACPSCHDYLIGGIK